PSSRCRGQDSFSVFRDTGGLPDGDMYDFGLCPLPLHVERVGPRLSPSDPLGEPGVQEWDVAPQVTRQPTPHLIPGEQGDPKGRLSDNQHRGGSLVEPAVPAAECTPGDLQDIAPEGPGEVPELLRRQFPIPAGYLGERLLYGCETGLGVVQSLTADVLTCGNRVLGSCGDLLG